MSINWNVATTNWYTVDAWRAGHQPDAIMEATKFGEQIIELMAQAIGLIELADADVDSIVQNARLRCQVILDQLYGHIDRLDLVLSRLRAASKAVRS